MALFHSFMLICSVESGCTILEGPKSPFVTREDCQASVKEGVAAINADKEVLTGIEEGKLDVSLVCHRAEDNFVPSEHYELLLKLYGPPKGEKA